MGTTEVRCPYQEKKKKKTLPDTADEVICSLILTGLAGIIIIEIYAAVMQREFQNTDNRVGKGFAILGIYLFVVCYC